MMNAHPLSPHALACSVLTLLTRFVWLVCGVLLACAAALELNADELPQAKTAADVESLRDEFERVVRPLVSKHCLECHDKETAAGKLSLSDDQGLRDVRRRHLVWHEIARRVGAHEMPPADAANELADSQRTQLIDWIRRFRRCEAERTAGDPGPALPHRLSAAEYNYTIRDLTGFDLQPARELPVDPANEAGFDNSGESLMMSPALLQKYLAAAQTVADHLLLLPEGLRFAPHPVLTDTDRDKYCVRRIIDFYQSHEIDLADYFQAAWHWKQVAHGDDPPEGTDFDEFASQRNVSGKYLRRVIRLLNSSEAAVGPIAELRDRWQRLASMDGIASGETLPAACRELRDFVLTRRKSFTAEARAPGVKGISSGSQAFILWKNKREAGRRRLADPDGPIKTESDTGAEPNGFDPAVVAANLEFCDVFPDAFVVTERGMNKGRPLSAGFHLMVGYFRDDQPLYDLVLNDAEQREIDQLWAELNFITSAPLRQYKDYVFFERAEPPRFMFDPQFDFARSEDHDVTSAEKMTRLASVYLAKAIEADASDLALEAIRDYFDSMSQQIRAIEESRVAAEPSHLEWLVQFAARAYRGHMPATETAHVREFYTRLRNRDQLTHEDAVRDTLVSILASPYFCYRWESAPAGNGFTPVSDVTLANRLSYFLWSSMPDETLHAVVASGRLREPQQLSQQIERMRTDTKVRGFVTEFLGNWLDFRRFEQHNAVDRERYPQFTAELRAAMYEEPIRYVEDAIRRDASVLDLLYGQHTFVNGVLANHYGMPSHDGAWQRVENAGQFGRGGLLPMSVFLTINAPGLRTSPVKRGYWVVRRVLGETIPPPPPTVPELPKDEAATGEKSVPELLAAHRAHASCAACHDRFDSIGLAFEGFDPIGQRRQVDWGGRAVTTLADYPDQVSRTGVGGLLEYLRSQRQDDFVDHLVRSSLAFALGRSLQLSDEITVERSKKQLADAGFRFSALIESIATSPQFLNQRQQSYSAND